MKIEDLLHCSPLRLITTEPQTTINEVAERMAHYNVGLIVVMDENDRVAGVLSERDIVRGLGSPGTGIENVLVADLMTKSVISVSPTDTLVDAVVAMNTHGIRHLIVMQANKPVGVISIRDVLRVFASQLLGIETKDTDHLKMDLVKALATV